MPTVAAEKFPDEAPTVRRAHVSARTIALAARIDDYAARALVEIERDPDAAAGMMANIQALAADLARGEVLR